MRVRLKHGLYLNVAGSGTRDFEGLKERLRGLARRSQNQGSQALGHRARAGRDRAQGEHRPAPRNEPGRARRCCAMRARSPTRGSRNCGNAVDCSTKAAPPESPAGFAKSPRKRPIEPKCSIGTSVPNLTSTGTCPATATRARALDGARDGRSGASRASSCSCRRRWSPRSCN